MDADQFQGKLDYIADFEIINHHDTVQHASSHQSYFLNTFLLTKISGFRSVISGLLEI